ncbi:MAG: hypothetical protein RIQ59_993 [Bacteroidota bacterium]|jgi:hypothetical protein
MRKQKTIWSLTCSKDKLDALIKSATKMNQYIGLFIYVTFLCSCSNHSEKEQYFVIKDLTKHHKTTSDPQSIETPFFYGSHNFILMNNSTIFYHDKFVWYGCGYGIDFTKPPRLYITPDSLVEIKLAGLEQFLKDKTNGNNFLSGKILGKNLVTISSPTDTIRNDALPILRKFFSTKKDFLVGIRRCTEEEKYVGFAKLSNRPYNGDRINWKIGFDQETPPSTKQTIEFIQTIK